MDPAAVLAALDPDQRDRVEAWLPGATAVADLSWGLVDTTVLRLHDPGTGRDVVLKAGGPDDHHIAREVEGYGAAAGPWTARGLAPRVLHADAGLRLLVVELLPGDLAMGTSAADDPGAHRQAGAALALLHRSGRRVSADFERRQRDYSRALLDTDHRIAPAAAQWLRDWLDAHDPGPVDLVPTHGDYSPRNWLVDREGVVRVIDLGRFDHRPAASDLVRLHERHWRDRPDLAAAFVEGYGADPRVGPVWAAQRVREAIGTATWALRVGDEAFEQEGHRTIAELVAGR